MNLERYLCVSPEVRAALRAGRPVVALDSSGALCDMPLADGLRFAREKERAVRDGGAVPATVAVLEGVLYVGASAAQLEALAAHGRAAKASRRDLPVLLATGGSAATTAAATMIAAILAGIPVFAAAGIGGARPGGFDVSADLQELRKSSIAVVCAGIKPGGDAALTLEYLETMGVPVLGLGSGEFPAFYCRDARYHADRAVRSEAEAAHIAKIKWDLGLAGGVLITKCIPAEKALDAGLAQRVLDAAHDDAFARGVHGRALTPHLMAHILQHCPAAGEALFTLARQSALAASHVAAALCIPKDRRIL